MDLVKSLSDARLCDDCHPVPVPLSRQRHPILGRWCLSSHRAWPGRGTLDMPWLSTRRTTTFRSRTWSRSSMDPTRYVLVTVIRLVISSVPCLPCCCIYCALPLAGAATSIIFVATIFLCDKQIFVATRLLSRQMSVATNIILLRQKFCHDKLTCLSRQNVSFVMTKVCLLQQNCCRDKNVLSQQT